MTVQSTGKGSYFPSPNDPLATNGQNAPVGPDPEAHVERFTPSLYRLTPAPGQPPSSLVVLLEALFAYQHYLATLPQDDYWAALEETLHTLIAQALDTMQGALSGQEGGRSDTL